MDFLSVLTELTAWHWLALALVLAALELILPATVLIWFALGAGATAGLMWYAPDLSQGIQLLVFGVASLLGLFIGRGLLRHDSTQEPELNQGSELLIGKIALVETPIVDGRGQVKVGDSVWTAIGPDAQAGARVRIVEAGSAVLTVERA